MATVCDGGGGNWTESASRGAGRGEDSPSGRAHSCAASGLESHVKDRYKEVVMRVVVLK